MNDRFIKLLAALATDGGVLAEYQSDPEATLARFGLTKGDMRDLIDALSKGASSPGDGLTAVTIDSPVTH